MEVRIARLEDAESIRVIYNVEVETSVATFDLTPRTLAEQEAWIAEHAGAHPAIVAVDGGDVVGFGSLSPFRDRPAYATTAEDSVYVRRDRQGRGIGRLLLTELVRIGTAHGFHALIARVGGHNEASIALHEACGFELVGVEREVGRKFGRWLDVVELQRLLETRSRRSAGPVD